MIFKVAYKKGAKILLKIDTQDGTDSAVQWMNTTDTVYNFVKEAGFEDGDKIGIEYIKKGKIYHVTRVNKDGDDTQVSEDKTADTTVEKPDNDKPTCDDCGKELKNDKYKKCYDCNQKNPVKNIGQRSPETVASIKTQCAYKAAAQALVAFTGQIADINTLKEQLDDLAEHILSKF